MRRSVLILVALSFAITSTVQANIFYRCMRALARITARPEEAPPTIRTRVGNFTTDNNPTLSVSAAEYRQGITRPEQALIHAFGDDYTSQKSHLRPGEVVIDAGSGLGVAAMEIANTGNNKVIAISVHNFWEGIEAWARYSKDDIQQDGSRTHSFAGITIEKLAEVGQSLKVPLNKAVGWDGRPYDVPVSWRTEKEDIFASPGHSPRDRKKTAEKFRYVAREILKIRAKLEAKELFQYEVNRSENVLPQYRGQVGLITDVCGAVFYSANKARLLEQYYDALTAGGKALILLEASGYGMEIPMVIIGKNRVPLFEYLEEKYPTIFKVEGKNLSRHLIIRRDPNIAKLDLKLKLLTTFVKYPTGGTGAPTGMNYVSFD